MLLRLIVFCLLATPIFAAPKASELKIELFDHSVWNCKNIDLLLYRCSNELDEKGLLVLDRVVHPGIEEEYRGAYFFTVHADKSSSILPVHHIHSMEDKILFSQQESPHIDATEALEQLYKNHRDTQGHEGTNALIRDVFQSHPHFRLVVFQSEAKSFCDVMPLAMAQKKIKQPSDRIISIEEFNEQNSSLLTLSTESVPDKELAQKAFTTYKQMTDIPHGHCLEGCSHRAHVGGERLKDLAFPVSKIWLYAPTSSFSPNVIQWRYHVALEVAGFVIDPTFCDQAATRKEWLERLMLANTQIFFVRSNCALSSYVFELYQLFLLRVTPVEWMACSPPEGNKDFPLFESLRKNEHYQKELTKIGTQFPEPLHLLVLDTHGRLEIFMERHSLDPNIRNSEGLTPLHAAANAQAGGQIQILLTARADPWIKDNKGQFALHRALQTGNKSVAQRLIDAMRQESAGQDEQDLFMVAALDESFKFEKEDEKLIVE